MFRLKCILLVLSVFNFSIVYAGFDEGVEAVKNGNHKLAFEIWSEAAKKGDAKSQHVLGVFYQSGISGFIEQDCIKSFDLINNAAAQGYQEAEFSLGVAYHKGCGVEKDLASAIKWYEMSANKGDLVSQFNLGALYYEQKNYTQAIYWYKKSANGGDAKAQNNLGQMYGEGRGVKKDKEIALALYILAASNGDVENRDNALSVLSNDSIKNAVRLSKNMKEIGVLQALDEFAAEKQ